MRDLISWAEISNSRTTEHELNCCGWVAVGEQSPSEGKPNPLFGVLDDKGESFVGSSASLHSHRLQPSASRLPTCDERGGNKI